mgnify:CR=1 FL=1
MSNLFQFIMYIIFGKHWIKYDMVQGYKMALFVNEAEIEMHKEKIQEATDRKAKLEEELAVLQESPLADPLTLLAPELHEDKREVQKMEYKIKQERADQIQLFKNRIHSAGQDVQLYDGELQKIYSITYTARRKYDFMKNYKVKRTYADDNK